MKKVLFILILLVNIEVQAQTFKMNKYKVIIAQMENVDSTSNFVDSVFTYAKTKKAVMVQFFINNDIFAYYTDYNKDVKSEINSRKKQYYIDRQKLLNKLDESGKPYEHSDLNGRLYTTTINGKVYKTAVSFHSITTTGNGINISTKW